MEAAGCSKTSVTTYDTATYHNPKDIRNCQYNNERNKSYTYINFVHIKNTWHNIYTIQSTICTVHLKRFICNITDVFLPFYRNTSWARWKLGCAREFQTCGTSLRWTGSQEWGRKRTRTQVLWVPAGDTPWISAPFGTRSSGDHTLPRISSSSREWSFAQ